MVQPHRVRGLVFAELIARSLYGRSTPFLEDDPMTTIAPKPESRIRRNPEIVHSSIDGEVVMMSVDKGEYFGLNAMGSHIWNELEEPRSVEDLCRALRERFEVSDGKCLEEVTRFLAQIAECGLVSVSE